jgi:hypothetical protein
MHLQTMAVVILVYTAVCTAQEFGAAPCSALLHVCALPLCVLAPAPALLPSRHALPPGYVLKSQMKELLEQERANAKDIAEVIEEERAKVEARTPITEEVRGGVVVMTVMTAFSSWLLAQRAVMCTQGQPCGYCSKQAVSAAACCTQVLV